MKNSQIAGVLIIGVIVLLGAYFYMQANKEMDQTQIETEVTATTTEAATSTDETEITESETPTEPTLRALDLKPWEWVSATYADGHTSEPNKAGDFVMTFGAGGGVSFETDCNSMSSSYEAYTGGLTFAPIASTRMYCEGSKETEFAELIMATKRYRFTDGGELILETETGDTILFR